MQKNNSAPKIEAIEVVLPKKVGIIYSDVQRDFFPTESQYITEKDAEKDARLIGEIAGRPFFFIQAMPNYLSGYEPMPPSW